MTTLNITTLASVQLNQVIEQLEQLLFCDLVMTYNDYASANHYELIHDNDEENINTLFDTPYDTAQAVVYGKYNPNDDYVMLDGYTNAVSFSYQLIQDENCPIDIEELAQWVVDNELFNNYDIEITTLDDMYNTILDNLEDASSLDDIIKVNDLLGLSLDYFDHDNESPADYESNLINTIMLYIEDDYDLLTKVAEYLKLDV